MEKRVNVESDGDVYIITHNFETYLSGIGKPISGSFRTHVKGEEQALKWAEEVARYEGLKSYYYKDEEVKIEVLK